MVGSVGVPCGKVPEISVFQGKSDQQLTTIRVRSWRTRIRAKTLDENVLEGDIAGFEDDRVPEWRVGNRDTVDQDILRSSHGERDRSSKDPGTAPSDTGAARILPENGKCISWQSFLAM
jgi:hypothetical protein